MRLRATSELRRRAGAGLLLIILVGLAGAAVLVGLAGARRGERALPQFIDRQVVPDASVYVGGEEEGGTATFTKEQEAAVLDRLPYVERASRGAPVIVAGRDVRAGAPAQPRLATVGLDPGSLARFGRPIVLEGRLPEDTEADATAIDEELADRAGLAVGDRYHVTTYTRSQLDDVGGGEVPAGGQTADLRVVGLVRYPQDLMPARTDQDNLYVQEPDLYLSAAFWERHGPDLATYGIGIALDLAGGRADVERLGADVRRLFGDVSFVEPVERDEGLVQVPLDGVRRAIDLESRALQAFAVLASVAGLVIVGQAVARQVAVEAVDWPRLAALGVTRSQLVAAATVRAAALGLAGAVLAGAGAVALSPLTPLGIARRAVTDPGVAVDGLVLGLGVPAIAVLVAACGALAAWRAARSSGTTEAATRASRRRDTAGNPAMPRVVAGMGLPAPAWTGAALVSRRGRASMPLHTALAAAVVTVLAVSAAAGFRSSLDHLNDDPAGFGVTWDASVGNGASAEEGERAERLLEANEDVADFAGLASQLVAVDGRSLSLLVIFPGQGQVRPRVVVGRAPASGEEIAFGRKTMEDLGVAVGDTVEVALQDFPPQAYRIVGEVVLNSAATDDAVTPAEGGLVLADGSRRLSPVPGVEGEVTFPQTFLVGLSPDADQEAALDGLERDFPGFVVLPLSSDEIDNLTRVSGLPAVLAGLVAVLGVGAVVHALVTTVRRRRRELAVLKGLGFVRRQVSATIVWPAVGFALTALLLGLPLGIAVGRWAWRLAEESLGVVSGPVVPTGVLAMIVVAALLVVALAAFVPAAVAGRLPPAATLRTE